MKNYVDSCARTPFHLGRAIPKAFKLAIDRRASWLSGDGKPASNASAMLSWPQLGCFASK